MRPIAALTVAFALGCCATASAEVEQRLGIGVFALYGGGDFHYSVRPADSRWSYGLRYLGWTDTFIDPFTGNLLTETEYRYAGLSLEYRFDPTAHQGWYLAVELLQASIEDRSLMTGEVGSDEALAAYFGGGWTGALGSHGYYDFGILLSPGASLETQTSVSETTEDGLFDVRLIVGFRF